MLRYCRFTLLLFVMRYGAIGAGHADVSLTSAAFAILCAATPLFQRHAAAAAAIDILFDASFRHAFLRCHPACHAGVALSRRSAADAAKSYR